MLLLGWSEFELKAQFGVDTNLSGVSGCFSVGLWANGSGGSVGKIRGRQFIDGRNVGFVSCAAQSSLTNDKNWSLSCLKLYA